MANQSWSGQGITGFCSRLIELAAQLLDPSEQEAVLGDLRELGVSQGRALREILGLVAWRQAALWANWRPWLSLSLLIIPLSLFLSVMAKFAAGESAVYIWLYVNNLDVALLGNSGFWYELAHSLPIVLAIFLKLFCGSWSAGFALGLFAAGTARISRGLLVLVLVLAGSIGAPAYLAFYREFLYRRLPGLAAQSDPISRVLFYRSLFPFLVETALVILPLLLGMHDGQLARAFPKPWRAGFAALVFLAIAELLFENSLPWVFWTPHLAGRLGRLRQFDMFALIVYWPLLYLLAMRTTRPMHANRLYKVTG
jgi:hypothetical protein